MQQANKDAQMMAIAYRLALEAAKEKEIPVGAIVVAEGKIIGKAYNQTERLRDVTAHAEILAITAASEYLGSKYLTGCTLYVTLEPCVMCAGALAWSQMSRLVFGASDEARGFSRLQENILHPKTSVTRGVLEEQCQDLLKEFFVKLRN